MASRTKKVLTKVSIRAELIRRARDLSLDISGLVEAALETAIVEAERRQWSDDNEDAIDAYNARVRKHGVFSDEWRRF